MELDDIIEEIIKAIDSHTAGTDANEFAQVAVAVKARLDKKMEGMAIATGQDLAGE